MNIKSPLKHTLLWVLALTAFSACNNNPDKSIIPSWTSEILGPLVKTEVTGEEVTTLTNLSLFSFNTLYEFGYGSQGEASVVIPETTLPPVTSSDTLNSFFKSMTLSAGTCRYTITNQLPINIKPGAVVVISQQGLVLLTDTIRQELVPRNGSYTSRNFQLAGKTLLPQVSFEIRNVATSGSATPVNLGTGEKISVEFFINDVKINSVTLKPGSYQLSDTSAFNLNGRVVDTEALSGNLITYVKNNFPFNAAIQFYFMDGNYVRKDSMFTVPPVIVPSTAQAPESRLQEAITQTKLQNVNQARFVNSQIIIFSTEDIVITNNNSVSIQIVGDLKFHVDN